MGNCTTQLMDTYLDLAISELTLELPCYFSMSLLFFIVYFFFVAIFTCYFFPSIFRPFSLGIYGHIQ